MLVYASGQCIETRSCRCSQWRGILHRLEWRFGGCELRLRSAPRYRLFCDWFPAPGEGLPVRT